MVVVGFARLPKQPEPRDMKTKLFIPLICAMLSFAYGEQQKATEEFPRMGVNWSLNEQDRATHARAWEMLTTAHKGLPRSERKLRVVYVTFKDRPALAGHKERYNRIMKNIQAYYADQMQANGFPALTFDLELDAQGKLILHEVCVDKYMAEVGIRSSGQIAREAARRVLAEKGIDIDKEHVLLVCQLPDGIGPYYGGGASHSGTAYTCDQVDLDPGNFASTEDAIEARSPMTKGRNSTVYIGGTAHELGHAFGLPHTGHSRGYEDSGSSLMGDGNYHYGEELRGEGKGAYLAPTDAMKLASLPLFSKVETTLTPDAGDGDFCGTYVPMEMEKIETTPVKDGVRVKGKVNMKRAPYGVVLHLDPPEDDPWITYDGSRFLRPRSWCDYDTSAIGGAINAQGEFDITITRPGYAKAEVELRVTVLYADGSRAVMYIPLVMTPEGGVEKKP